MKFKLSFVILMTLAVLTLSSCACSNDTINPPSPSPSITATPLPAPSFTPEPSMMPDETVPAPSPDGESTATPDDPAVDAPDGPTMMGVDIEKLILELEKLSEVDTAEVVAHGGRAIVGLNFDAQYQGTLTDRIEEMVVSAVTTVEEMLTDVAVTADPTLVTEIRTLAAEIKDAEWTEDQTARFTELYEKITPAKTDSATPEAE